MHARAVRVEDAGDLDAQPVLAVALEDERLGAALAFVVAGADADRVHVPPVVLVRCQGGDALSGRRRLHCLRRLQVLILWIP